MVAIESRKHAARRPSPPLPRPASGSCSRMSSQSRSFCSTTRAATGSSKRFFYVVSERATDQELQREVVDPLRVLPGVRFLGLDPSLGEHVPNGAGEGLETLASTGGRERNDVVEGQMALVERVVGPDERNRATTGLPEELRGRRAQLLMPQRPPPAATLTPWGRTRTDACSAGTRDRARRLPALLILHRADYPRSDRREMAQHRLRAAALHTRFGYRGAPRRGPLADPMRSEERRVGKECRSRWSTDA